jgi:hypothetical protein
MDIDKVAAKWIDILRLSDWDIDIEVCRYHQMPDGALGLCSTSDVTRHAEIKLLDPNDIPPCNIRYADLEMTLLHELMHVVFWGTSDESKSRVAFEQAIEATARALLVLDKTPR